MMFVFQGWALGLFGQLNRPQLYVVVVLAWIVMLAWSKLGSTASLTVRWNGCGAA